MARRVDQGKTRRAHTGPKRLSTRQLNELVEDAILDAHDESEQRVGFHAVLEEHLAVPFTTTILGMSVEVEGVDFNDAEEIVAICRRGRHRQLISLADLPLPSPPPRGWEWVQAYRHWIRGGR
ncbi:MAG: hypothetical protein DMG02_00935 [Acidobacteria bacterium]|nr:MAG: hypothetical protein DMG02_00935 [Acidobacteriota bacterium]